MFHVPNKFRVRDPHMALASDDTEGNNGAFKIPLDKDVTALVVASDGLGWEHVSVHVEENGFNETPTWDEMCEVKDMFWDSEDCVIQYHPPKSEYVNNHTHVLHMWRPTEGEIQCPPSILVGIKTSN